MTNTSIAPDPDDFMHVVAKYFLARLALLVTATEAALFSVDYSDGEVHLSLFEHVRGGPDNPAEIKRAIQAFEEIAIPCVRERKDGAIRVSNEEPALYCLVHVLYHQREVPKAVAAWIIRAVDAEAARASLRRIRGTDE